MARTTARSSSLRAARLAAGLTELDVAYACKCNPQTVRRWESGQHHPSHVTLLALAKLYRVPTVDLLASA